MDCVTDVEEEKEEEYEEEEGEYEEEEEEEEEEKYEDNEAMFVEDANGVVATATTDDDGNRISVEETMIVSIESLT